MIKNLRLFNVRGLKDVEFNFCAGVNLLVGDTGVGKTTTLDAIRILLSEIRQGGSTSQHLGFRKKDIRFNAKSLLANLRGEHNKQEFVYHKLYRKNVQPNTNRAINTSEDQPLVLFFGIDRSIINKKPIRGSLISENLDSGQFFLEPFLDWCFSGQESTKGGKQVAERKLSVVNTAVRQVLAGCSLQVVKKGTRSLLVRKGSITLELDQLSNGERGILAIVLGLIQSLAQSNPNLDNPAWGKAIVLIDELELHLHPILQRNIIGNLSSIFPNCQFIATTNSAQMISEVEPEGVTFLVRQGDQIVTKPAIQSYGLDTNWILESLMNASSRPKLTQQLIDQIEDLLEEGQLEQAQKSVEKLREMLHGDDCEVVRLEASINSLLALACEYS